VLGQETAHRSGQKSTARTAVPSGGMNATAPGTRLTAGPSDTVSHSEVTIVLGSSRRDLVLRTPR
jgi:hypothetical protein